MAQPLPTFPIAPWTTPTPLSHPGFPISARPLHPSSCTTFAHCCFFVLDMLHHPLFGGPSRHPLFLQLSAQSLLLPGSLSRLSQILPLFTLQTPSVFPLKQLPRSHSTFVYVMISRTSASSNRRWDPEGRDHVCLLSLSEPQCLIQ